MDNDTEIDLNTEVGKNTSNNVNNMSSGDEVDDDEGKYDDLPPII